MLDLSGKVAVVTGAGSGIGRGIANAFARAGASVLCADYFGDRAEAAAAEIIAAGGKARHCVVNVKDKSSNEAMVDFAVREMGGIHIAVANAGIARGGSVLTMTEADWDEQVDVNLKGVFLTVQAASRAMVRQDRGGRIICIASMAAERPNMNVSGYCATKAGVRMMCRCWALDLAPFGITVNSIGPGIIDTPLGASLLGEGDQRSDNERTVPVGRAGIPMDIGNAACWLASDEAEYVTGTYTLVDGGLSDAAGFGIAPVAGNPMIAMREARRSAGGAALLDQMDQQTAAAMSLFDEQRKARGLL